MVYIDFPCREKRAHVDRRTNSQLENEFQKFEPTDQSCGARSVAAQFFVLSETGCG